MAILKLYHLTGAYSGYDVYTDAIVAAYSSKQARKMHPSGDYKKDPLNPEHWKNSRGVWADKPEEVNSTFIGIAAKSIKEPTIITTAFSGC